MKAIEWIIYGITLAIFAIAFVLVYCVVYVAILYATRVVAILLSLVIFYKIACFFGRIYQKRLTKEV
jgi:hypothetical protein